MNDARNNDQDRRSYPARIAITALNVLAPGLGLLRVGDWRTCLLLLPLPFAFAVLFTFGLGLFPVTNFALAILALVVALGVMILMFAVAAMITWPKTALRSRPRWWSRWYSLITVAITISILLQIEMSSLQHIFKGFYLPSESMAPNLGKGDKVVSDMRWRGPMKRGEIIIFRGRDSARVSRIAAIAGDTISMRNGLPIVNGIPAVQSTQQQITFLGYGGIETARGFTERLPGEVGQHRIIKVGPSEFDNTAAVVVPKDHFFVLGDNRDRSADSRVPLELEGAGMVPVTAIMGRVTYIYWSADRSKIGTRFDL